jgi:hypothetical protein
MEESFTSLLIPAPSLVVSIDGNLQGQSKVLEYWCVKTDTHEIRKLFAFRVISFDCTTLFTYY